MGRRHRLAEWNLLERVESNIQANLYCQVFSVAYAFQEEIQRHADKKI